MEVEKMSLGEKIAIVAEARGSERRQRIGERVQRTVDISLGLVSGDVAAMMGEAAKAKGAELKARAEILKDRTEARLAEAANSLKDRAERGWNRFWGRVTETKDKAVAKAKDLGTRSVEAGLTAATWVEDKVVGICEVPAGVMEAMAGGLEAKAEVKEEKLSSRVVEQAAREANLSVEQQEIVRRILEAQEAAREKIAAKHEAARDRLQAGIEGARQRAAELQAGAVGLRAKVESRRRFRGWLTRFLGS